MARVAAVVGLCCLTLAVGWWSKARCLLDDGGWTDSEEYLDWCYTDVVPLYVHRGLADGAVPYVDEPLEYPVLTGAQMWLLSLPVDSAAEYLHVTAALGGVFILTMIGVLAAGGVPPGRLAWVAAAPTLAVYAFLNWDPLPTLLLATAVVAHLRGRDVLSGVAAGLGVAAKLFPGLVVPLVVAARVAQRRHRDAVAHAAAAGAAWVVVNLPVMLAAPEGWSRFLELNRERPPNWDSLWYLGQQGIGTWLPVSTVNAWSAALFLAGAAVIGVVGARRRDPSRWWQLVLPMLCWFLLVNKVYSPQYSLWLLPLLALALPRPAPYWAFVIADLCVFAVEFPFLGGHVGAAAAPGLGVFAIAFVARAAVLAWITVESTLRPPPNPRMPRMCNARRRRPASASLRGWWAPSGDAVASGASRLAGSDR